MKKVVSVLLVFCFLFIHLVFSAKASTKPQSDLMDSIWESFYPPTESFRDVQTNERYYSTYFKSWYRVYRIDTTYTQATENYGLVGKFVETELPSTDISNLNTNAGILFPNATFLSTATNQYNSHSYAWYSQNISTNHYWIDDPTFYVTDHSFIQVTTPQVGDIVCYLDTYGSKIHSGIIYSIQTGTSNGLCGIADLLTVESKWELAGLYRHNGYECPYTSYSNNGDAVSLAFYRAHVHSYTHSYTDNGDDATHTSHCICGATIVENHNWRQVHLPSAVDPEEGNRYVVGWKCSKCNAITYYNPNLK